MRSVGVDVAGGGIAAIALAVRNKPKLGAIWQPPKKESEPTKLLMWSHWLEVKYNIFRPDIIAVEELAVFMNKKVIRSLSKFEGVALLEAKKKRNAIVVNPPVTQARSIVFEGQGVRSKEDAWEAFKEQYPDFQLPAANRGGMDIADAMVHALAAPAILERRRR